MIRSFRFSVLLVKPKRPPTIWRLDSNGIPVLAWVTVVTVGFLGLAAEPHVEQGDGAAIRGLLERVRARKDPRNRDDSLIVHYLVGTVALLQADLPGAVAGFDRADGYQTQAMRSLRRALAYEKLGQLDSARAGLGRIIAQPVFGVEGQIGWIRTMIEIGRVEERLGRFDDATAS